MKKMKFGKVLTTVALGVALVTVKPPIQYATTSDSENPFKHSMNKLATTIGVMTPHQDTFTATMQSDMGIDAGVANYRTYFKAGETLNIKITFTSTVQENNENPRLVLKFGENGTERVVENPTIENDYVLFEYTIQNGDNGGLIFTHLSGSVSDENGNVLEIALPTDKNLYQNKIIADTTKPRVNWKIYKEESIHYLPEKHIESSEKIYILENGIIRDIKNEDVYFIKENGVVQGSNQSVYFYNNNIHVSDTAISDSSLLAICINAVDIAGNPISIHYDKNALSSEIRGNKSDIVDFMIAEVTTDEDTVENNSKDGIIYLKAGKKVIIKTWQADDTSKAHVKVAFGDNQSYKEATYVEREGNLYVWEYEIQEGDDGAVKVKLEGECHCGNPFTNTAEKVFDNMIADTIAPEVTRATLKIDKYNNGWLASAKLSDEDSIYNYKGRKTTANDEIILYTNRQNEEADKGALWFYDTYLKLKCDVIDNGSLVDKAEIERSHVNNPELSSYKASLITDSSYEGKVWTSVGSSGEWNFKMKIKDIAGNELIYEIPHDNFKTVLDYLGPEVKIEYLENESDKNQLKFNIIAKDPKLPMFDETEYDGSGFYSKDGSAHKDIDINKIIVTNGTIIENRFVGGTASKGYIARKITVIPNGDGLVKVCVLKEATEDNLGHRSGISNIAEVTADRTAPVITDIQGNPTNWVKETTLTVVAYDQHSGLAEEAYSFDGGNTWQAKNSIKVTQNGTITVAVKDQKGNITTTNIEITKIDNTLPMIENIEAVQASQNTAEVRIYANDEHSGVMAYSFDGGENWQTGSTRMYTNSEKIASGQIKVKDQAGNEMAYEQEFVVQPDTSKPMIKFENNGGQYTIPTGKNQVTVNTTIEAVSNNSCTIYYGISNSKTQEPSNYSQIVSNKTKVSMELTEGKWYLWAYAKDNKTGKYSNKYTTNAFDVKKSTEIENPKTSIEFDTTTRRNLH